MDKIKWVLAPAAPAELAGSFGVLPIVAQIMYSRGLASPTAVHEFLHPELAEHDPFRLQGMTQAVARIRRALSQQEPIAVYGDYDVDGVTATALLVHVLRALGGEAFPYIPHRVEEGYGLNLEAIQRLHTKVIEMRWQSSGIPSLHAQSTADLGPSALEELGLSATAELGLEALAARALEDAAKVRRAFGMGAGLLLTVDCGIRSVREVAYARELGLDVIITDHHGVGPELPQANAIINPKQPGNTYPDVDLSGVGLAFKLAQALLRLERAYPTRARDAVPIEEADLLDVVALGTVADVAPLVGENRRLVRAGLRQIQNTKRPGLRALLKEAGVSPDKVTAMAIGFYLGPRLNAAGRLADAMNSYQLLMTSSDQRAQQLAVALGQKNRERQAKTSELLEQAKAQLASEGIGDIILIAGKQYLAGVAGLVAGRLTTEFYRPAVVLEVGAHESKASARSIPEFHITQALDQCAELLVRHGGHAEAAGFTVRNENWLALCQRLRAIAAEQLAGKELQRRLAIDAEVALAEADESLLAALEPLQPFGHGNPEPSLVTLNLEASNYQVVGNGHLRFEVREGETFRECIAFRQAEWAVTRPPRVDLVYSLGLNEFRGNRTLQLYVKDMRPASGPI